LSLCCTANGKHEAGIAWYKEMVGKHPEDYRLVFGYANILYNNSIYEEAISNYELAFKLRPTFVKPLVDLALLYEYRRIHKRKSTQKSREILELEPNNQYALFILARNENDIDKKILQLQ
jgi:tetratricopeptide (TPR) repeat protein